ncbi:hypothetical protein BKA70DRAFT_1483538 [Coprinopsis sp. MPI-PUGE-AT-0042]|nr:hypothetical protein BKA70DRAFT_1483538 [Coprinopsis sp. MPI-PUGE-AT-0042]
MHATRLMGPLIPTRRVGEYWHEAIQDPRIRAGEGGDHSGHELTIRPSGRTKNPDTNGWFSKMARSSLVVPHETKILAETIGACCAPFEKIEKNRGKWDYLRPDDFVRTKSGKLGEAGDLSGQIFGLSPNLSGQKTENRSPPSPACIRGSWQSLPPPSMACIFYALEGGFEKRHAQAKIQSCNQLIMPGEEPRGKQAACEADISTPFSASYLDSGPIQPASHRPYSVVHTAASLSFVLISLSVIVAAPVTKVAKGLLETPHLPAKESTTASLSSKGICTFRRFGSLVVVPWWYLSHGHKISEASQSLETTCKMRIMSKMTTAGFEPATFWYR